VYISIIVALVIIISTTTVSIQNVNASGLGVSDIANHPEAVCILYGDLDDMKDLCDWINICDDSGEINSTSEFCTGKAVRNIPGVGCPVGYHSNEDDESGLCYDNDLGCQHDYLIFNNDKTSCIEYKIQCEYNPDHPLCNGVERSDGIKVCDQPDHPGYKFCNNKTANTNETELNLLEESKLIKNLFF
jgi:hypothetical protein